MIIKKKLKTLVKQNLSSINAYLARVEVTQSKCDKLIYELTCLNEKKKNFYYQRFCQKIPSIKKYNSLVETRKKRKILTLSLQSIEMQLKVILLIANKKFNPNHNLKNLAEMAGRYLPEQARNKLKKLNSQEEEEVEVMSLKEFMKIISEFLEIYCIVNKQIHLLLNK